MMFSVTTHHGSGVLHRGDGTLWGPVHYSIVEADLGPSRLFRGVLDPLTDVGDFPFASALGMHETAFLQLADGQWWLCAVHPDGEAFDAGGLLPREWHPQAMPLR